MAAGETATFEDFNAGDGAPEYLTDALKDVGLQEYIIRGNHKASNPAVERFAEKATGKRCNVIDTPWCAFFVGAKLEYHDITCTKSGMARSYLRWGQEVENNDDAQPGDIVVIWRGRKDDGITGHVFFFLEWNEDGSVKGVGGNQGDQVSIASFPSSKILGIRRPRGVTKSRTIRASLGSAGSETASKLVDIMPDSKLDTAMSFLDQIQSPLQALSHLKPQLKMVLEFIAIALALYAAYCRFSDHKSGHNT